MEWRSRMRYRLSKTFGESPVETFEFKSLDLQKTALYLNPSLPRDLTHQISEVVEQHPTSSMVWLMSSGTSSTNQSSFKLMGLHQKALLASAQAVNEHLQVSPNDHWLNILPLFHVGGLSILYRAHSASVPCSQAWNPNFKWNPEDFVGLCEKQRATLTSLVPTQVFDLLQKNLRPPSSLRVVLVGGGALNKDLYRRARLLGWPLLPSFGMTEAASQIATAKLNSLQAYPQPENPSEDLPSLSLLHHIKAQTDEDQRLSISGPSVLDGYYPIIDGLVQSWVDPKVDGWYQTQDRAELNAFYLTPLSRADEVLKIRGENVNLADLRNRLEALRAKQFAGLDVALVALPHERVGFVLILAGAGPSKDLDHLKELFNSMVLPFERISHTLSEVSLPKTDLGKIRYALLLQWVQQRFRGSSL